jgi:Tol biopolymer transport system component
MRPKLGAAAPSAGAIALLVVTAALAVGAGRRPPVPAAAAPADSLIRDGETHFAHLWQLTFGGENAEGYWSADGSKLIFQRTAEPYACDQMFVMDLHAGTITRVSTGAGRTTCGYFVERDRRVLFSSTHLAGDACPPVPDFSQGYVWPIYDSYDIFTAKPDGSDLRRITDTPGYDAEATVSVDGTSVVFTSTRDGDLDLYRMAPDGSNVRRLTDTPGYDGGAFYSRDGRWIVWRASHPADSALVEYRALLADGKVRPSKMDLWVMRADGTGKRQVTDKPGASFAPYFTPDGRSILYSSNWENPHGRNFDLYLVDVAGGEPRAVTRDPSFDGFPMFSPDGRWLVFASNRGAKARGETNLFLAEWKR